MTRYESETRRLIRATNEDAVGSWVIRALEEEGSTVRVLGRPDRDPTLWPDLVRRVDWWVSVDGVETAIEVTSFTSGNERWALEVAMEARRTIEATLAGDPRSILVAFTYDPVSIRQLPRNQRERDAPLLAEAIAALLRDHGEIVNHHLQSDERPSWTRHVSVSASVNPPRPHLAVVTVTPEIDVAARVDGFIRERIADKGDQHLGWGHGILAILHGRYESADDVIAGFVRHGGPIPWWRVYWTDSSARAHLVAEGSDRPP